MSRLPVPGQDKNTWGGILNDYLSQSHNADGTLQTNAVLTAAASTFAQLDSSAKLAEAIIPDSIPAYIYELNSTYPLRNSVTDNNRRTVIWVGIDAPTIGLGYAINDIDIWEPSSV